MNNIYKVVKNSTTGLAVAVSELAKGAKKGNKLRLASLAILGTLSSQLAADIGIPQGFDPAYNSNKVGSVAVSGSGQIVDLGIGSGLSSPKKGQEVFKHTITTSDSVLSLYTIKYANVASASEHYGAVKKDYDAGIATQSDLQNAQDALQYAKDQAALISDDKLKVSDPNNLIGGNSQGIAIAERALTYRDPITDKAFQITVKDDLVKTEAKKDVSGGGISVGFYEKTAEGSQYSDLQLIHIEGADTDVTIKNTAGSGVNDSLNAVSKNGSGVISLADGADLTIESDISYYIGGIKSVSTPFVEHDQYTSKTGSSLYNIQYKGSVNTALGPKNIQSEADFNSFNKELIRYIQTNEQLRLDYPSPEAMQAFYNEQIAGLYHLTSIGSYSVEFSLSKEELAQLAIDQGLGDAFDNRVTNDDKGVDIGLDNADRNHLVGVTGSGSVVTVADGSTVKRSTKNSDGNYDFSSGTVIRADFVNSGLSGNNIFKIDGAIDAGSGTAISAKNGEVYVSETGIIKGNIVVNGTGNNGSSLGNVIENAGVISGTVETENGKVINLTGASIGAIRGGNNLAVINNSGGQIQGSVSISDNSRVDNSSVIGGSVSVGSNATVMNSSGSLIGGGVSAGEGAVITNESGSVINGGIIAQKGSRVVNEADATVKGTAIVVGQGASFVNNGVVGGAHAAGGATSINNNLIVGSGVVSLDDRSSLVNEGNIYIGYVYDGATDNVKVGQTNSANYTAMSISGVGTKLANNKSVFVSATQHDVNVVSVLNGGEYSDTTDSMIVLNKENQTVTQVNKDRGNDNKAVSVKGSNAKATIKGLIELNDIGSTGLWVTEGGLVELSGSINLNSQNRADQSGSSDSTVQIRNFGAWIEGEGAKLIMDGNAKINLNADRAIGIHIRDGATADIKDTAGMTFSDKENQIGFLISSISKAASINYTSSDLLKLNGKGSVLFRVERGSIFNADTLVSTNPSLSVLDANGTEGSTLMVITNGPAATGVNNQTNADLSGFTLKVNGQNAKGVSVEGGANATITDGTRIVLTGDNAILAQVDGFYYDLNGVNVSANNGSSYLASSANLTTDLGTALGQIVTGQNSVGYYITHGGALGHKGAIDFKNPSKNNIGVKIDSGGRLISESGSYIKVYGTAIEISGTNSQAIIDNASNGNDPVVWAIGDASSNSDSAYHVKDRANLTLTGLGLTKAEGTAHGILVNGASNIVLDGATLDLYASGSLTYSSGHGIENRSSLSNIQLSNSATINVKDGYGIHSAVGFSQSASTSGIINVYGQGAGIRFEGIDSATGNVLGTTTNAIDNSGYQNVVINVYGSNGQGIYVDSSKNVHTSASVNILSGSGQSALKIKGTTQTASQSGNLYSGNKNATIVDLNNGYINTFTNNGQLLFGSFSSDSNATPIFAEATKQLSKDSYAIQTLSTQGPMKFTNNVSGKINGVVELLGYNATTGEGNIVNLKGEGNIFRTGDGDDTFVIDRILGDDLGGENQAKQFTQLDGGNGHDSVTFKNSADFTISKNETLKNIDYIALENNSRLTLNNIDSADGLTSGTQTYDIVDSLSLLTYKRKGSNTQFDRVLKGSGTFSVDLQSLDEKGNPLNQFAFDSSTNTGDFTGTVELTNAKYTLFDSPTAKNTQALSQATLKASANSYVNVELGDQQIKGLTLAGGTVDFGSINIGDEKSDRHVVVDNLVLEKGRIQIDTSGSIYNPGVPSSLPLLEQDNAIIFTKLASANTVSGGAINLDIDRSKITLFDEKGREITDPNLSDLVQNSETVARATYDTRVTKGSMSDGLYVGYGLTKVELKVKNDASGNGNALILDATNSDPAKTTGSDLDALVSDYDNGDGTFSYGDLQIRGNRAVTLSGSNSYHGSTFVKDTAQLISGSHDALGSTRLLQLDANTQYDLNGWSQTLGSLSTASDSIVNINGGELTVSGQDGTDATANLNSAISAGSLMGSGRLTIGDSTLTRTRAYLPRVILLGDNAGLTADVLIAANGEVNSNSQGALGSGKLTNNGSLNLYLSKESVLSNDTLEGNGVLNKYNAGALTLTLDKAKDFAGVVNVNAGAIVFKGDNTLSSGSYAAGDINIASAGALIAIDDAVFQGNVNNGGSFYIGELPASSAVSSSVVTINDYRGASGSRLIFNATLSDDDSPINKLVINGNAVGASLVSVNNIGGLGAATVNGISIIDVIGTSDAEFIQSGRIIAGAYDYKLQRSDVNSSNWVLTSSLTIRPEVGGYISNIFSANNLFNHQLHDRLGETQYTDLVSGEKKVTSMWIRQQYGYNKYGAGGGDLAVKDTWNITQLGGDIAQWSSNGLNRLHVGVMAGHGRSTGTSRAKSDGVISTGTLDGYGYGLYATWYDNNDDKTGLYMDTWALWNDFDASISGSSMSEKYRLKGLTASVESGYSFATGTLGNFDIWLQPKGQLIWEGVKAKDRVERNGTHVGFNDGNLKTRLGLRASLMSNSLLTARTNQSGQLFMEVNWLHNSKLYDITFNDELTLGQDGARNIGEVKVGVEGNIYKNTNVWFNLAGQRGDHHYQNASTMVGLKYSF